MARPVLDSYAVLVFLFDEPGAALVERLLKDAVATGSVLPVCAPNWAEVRYIIQRKLGPAGWERVRARLMGLPIEVVPVDRFLAERAGDIKVRGRMSLADCFAAALASERGVALCTGDPEFKALEKEVEILWLQESEG